MGGQTRRHYGYLLACTWRAQASRRRRRCAGERRIRLQPGAASNLLLVFATTFIRIIATWHSYAISILISAWVPTLADSVIPFLIGAIEFLVIASTRLSVQAWLLSMAG